MTMIDKRSIDELLTHTESLMNHVYWVYQDFNLEPKKNHHGASINYTDIKIRKDDFVKELVNTITSWVYSKAKYKEIIDQALKERKDDNANASSFITNLASSKFRPGGHPQGQFGELLLFNFIQHFFEAVPLLRKMRILTNPGMERFGADAIHYKYVSNKNVFILGESKCYESKYKFKDAFKASLESIKTTSDNFFKEISLYVYDDFIEKELEDIAKQLKENKLSDVYFEYVSLIIYNETNMITGSNETEILNSILETIKKRCNSLIKDDYKVMPDKVLLNRINYIIFPVWCLDDVLNDFQKLIGV